MCNLHNSIIDSIKLLDPEFGTNTRYPWKDFCLTGGGSMYANIAVELYDFLQPHFDQNIKIVAPPERDLSIWIGGSIYASLSTK